MDYTEEWKRATALRAELESLVRDLTEMLPDYEPFRDMVAELLLGTTPVILVECEDGEEGECRVEGREPIGGLWSSYRYLVDVIVALELELDFEQESAKVDPEYLI